MQQQALVAQSAYLSPVATVAAVQMQQLAALNPSSIIATPIASITPSSGNERQKRLASAGPDSICAWNEDRYKSSSWPERTERLFSPPWCWPLCLKTGKQSKTLTEFLHPLWIIYSIDSIVKPGWYWWCSVDIREVRGLFWQHSWYLNISDFKASNSISTHECKITVILFINWIHFYFSSDILEHLCLSPTLASRRTLRTNRIKDVLI